jgi:predicted TPR repeat methyltransferase
MASSPHAGSAGHYAVGRVDYPIALADALARELGLDGSGRLLDIGCGPGKFTLQLAPLLSRRPVWTRTGHVGWRPGRLPREED